MSSLNRVLLVGINGYRDVMLRIGIDGIPHHVSGLVCDPPPPFGTTVYLHVVGVGLHARDQSRIEFEVRGSSYRGDFRLVGYTLRPGMSEYTYSSVGKLKKIA